MTKYWRLGKYEFGFSSDSWTIASTQASCECRVYEFGPLFVTRLSPLCEDIQKDIRKCPEIESEKE